MGGELKSNKLKRVAEPIPLQYVALTGLNYGCTDEQPEGVRIEAGDTVPAEIVAASPWLLDQGHVIPQTEVTK